MQRRPAIDYRAEDGEFAQAVRHEYRCQPGPRADGSKQYGEAEKLFQAWRKGEGLRRGLHRAIPALHVQEQPDQAEAVLKKAIENNREVRAAAELAQHYYSRKRRDEVCAF